MAGGIDNFEEFGHVDPKGFFANQEQLLGNEGAHQGDEYLEFCHDAAWVMRTPQGQRFMRGLARLVEFGSGAFRLEDAGNPTLAAYRDGAQSAVTESLLAAAIGKKPKADPDFTVKVD